MMTMAMHPLLPHSVFPQRGCASCAGERAMAADNSLLATVTLDNLPPLRAYMAKVTVEFEARLPIAMSHPLDVAWAANA